MDNHQKRYSNPSNRFEPFQAIGKLMFFDYNKNKFGFISEVKGMKDIQVDKVHISESGLSTEKRLQDGDLLAFTLHRGQKGFFATNVKSFDEITLKTIADYIDLIGINEIERVIYNSVKYNYSLLDDYDKEIIARILLKSKEISAWSLIMKIKCEKLTDTYLKKNLDLLDGHEKLSFLNKAFDKTLLLNILSEWTTQDKAFILNLVEAIGNKKITNEQVPKTFISIVTNLDWSFDEIWKIYSVFDSSEIANQVLNKFSFIVYNCVNKLKTLIPEISSLTVGTQEKLKSNLESEIDNISANKLIEIYTDLKDYQIIKSENQLLTLLSDKVLKDSAFSDLILLLSGSHETDTFRKIISNNVANISSWKIIELIESCGQKYELAKVLIDEYYTKESEALKPDYGKIIKYLKESNIVVLSKHFLDIFYKKLSLKSPTEILELAISSNHLNAQKFAYQNLTFNSESEIIYFIDKFSNLNISNEVLSTNKPLTGFHAFLTATFDFDLTDECKSFFEINKGIVQCLTVKFLIYQFYKQKISKSKLIEVLDSFQWTEISALLVKTFIEESSHSEKILLDKLSDVFKTHFEILSSQSFKPKSFFDNFTIRNILNSCNGRKYYNGELWQRNGISRWYINGEVSTHTQDTMNCYCEGRPWKMETFWDSRTKQPLAQQYEKYWCKTSYCASRNDFIDLEKPYYEWTISEIQTALNIKIEKNALATLAGWANRMNQILSHLFCRNCNEVLRPIPFRPGTLGYYAVPIFNCINDKCPENGKQIRFTHCLNGKCESHKTSEPLDSRDCESCKPNEPNHTGLKCKYCGQLCPSCSGQYQRITAQDVW